MDVCGGAVGCSSAVIRLHTRCSARRVPVRRCRAGVGALTHCRGVGVTNSATGLVHAGRLHGKMRAHDSLRGSPRVVWCTANLRTDTLSVAWESAQGMRSERPALSMSVPRLGECFAYMAQGFAGTVTLVLPSESVNLSRPII
jgi:hypothetical protein